MTEGGEERNARTSLLSMKMDPPTSCTVRCVSPPMPEYMRDSVTAVICNWGLQYYLNLAQRLRTYHEEAKGDEPTPNIPHILGHEAHHQEVHLIYPPYFLAET